MAKKKSAKKMDRSDPKQNKSKAIRLVLESMPNAKASEIVAEVKKQYGHTVNANRVYMVKTKSNMAAGRKRGKGGARGPAKAAPHGASQWVEAIKDARRLLKSAGSLESATALLKAVDG